MDVYFKAVVDERFREQLVALKFGRILNIETTITYPDYDPSFGTLSFTLKLKLFKRYPPVLLCLPIFRIRQTL